MIILPRKNSTTAFTTKQDECSIFLIRFKIFIVFILVRTKTWTWSPSASARTTPRSAWTWCGLNKTKSRTVKNFAKMNFTKWKIVFRSIDAYSNTQLVTKSLNSKSSREQIINIYNCKNAADFSFSHQFFMDGSSDGHSCAASMSKILSKCIL